MWLAGMTRPCIADAARAVARHSQNPCERHWVAVEKILAYRNAMRDLSIMYKRRSRLSLIVFINAE